MENVPAVKIGKTRWKQHWCRSRVICNGKQRSMQCRVSRFQSEDSGDLSQHAKCSAPYRELVTTQSDV